ERNPLRAGLTRRAEAWPWSSLHRRQQGHADAPPRLSEWPVDMPRHWLDRVNAAETAAEREALQLSIRRGQPFGAPSWQRRIAERLDLTQTLRPRGRPRKQETA